MQATLLSAWTLIIIIPFRVSNAASSLDKESWANREKEQLITELVITSGLITLFALQQQTNLEHLLRKLGWGLITDMIIWEPNSEINTLHNDSADISVKQKLSKAYWQTKFGICNRWSKKKPFFQCFQWKPVVARWFFKPNIPIRINFGWSCDGKYWSILWPFDTFYGHLVYFTAIWNILRSFGIFYVHLVYSFQFG
jgi:hypothetical protein